jgi:hypothetical protein
MTDKRLLIIGCGRSGTRYVSKVLGRCGLKMGHERPGENGMASWVSLCRPGEIEEYDFVFHQVREPLGVISSFQTVMNRSWRKIYDAEPRIDREEPKLLRCMKYWLYWNQLCEEKARKTYRVENIRKALPEMLELMGVPPTEDVLNEAKQVPTNDHTRVKGHKVSDTYKAVTWDDLECEDIIICTQIRDQAIRYGYDI